MIVSTAEGWEFQTLEFLRQVGIVVALLVNGVNTASPRMEKKLSFEHEEDVEIVILFDATFPRGAATTTLLLLRRRLLDCLVFRRLLLGLLGRGGCRGHRRGGH